MEALNFHDLPGVPVCIFDSNAAPSPVFWLKPSVYFYYCKLKIWMCLCFMPSASDDLFSWENLIPQSVMIPRGSSLVPVEVAEDPGYCTTLFYVQTGGSESSKLDSEEEWGVIILPGQWNWLLSLRLILLGVQDMLSQRDLLHERW